MFGAFLVAHKAYLKGTNLKDIQEIYFYETRKIA